MTKTRQARLMATALLACAVMTVSASWATPVAAASDVPPYCVMRGGPRGPGSLPQLCRFFDYQACLWAAADLHGNCVQNIDYHGEISTAPGPARTRQRRY